MIKQRGNESKYVARFNSKEALQILELDEARVVEAIQKGMTSQEFFGSLCRKLPTTMWELMKRTEKYLRQDNALTTSQFAREVKERSKGIGNRK